MASDFYGSDLWKRPWSKAGMSGRFEGGRWISGETSMENFMET
jgi:hypothetical protein